MQSSSPTHFHATKSGLPGGADRSGIMLSRSRLFRISSAGRGIQPAGGHILSASHAAHHATHQATGAKQPQRHRRSYAEPQCAHTAHRHHFAMSFIHGEKTPFTMKTTAPAPQLRNRKKKRPAGTPDLFLSCAAGRRISQFVILISCLSWQPCAGCTPWLRQERSRHLRARQSEPWRS